MDAQNQQKNAADARFMRLALEQAAKGSGKTSPNPAVGAVIVQEGRVLAGGYHRAAGQPHAEIEALRALDDRQQARGATLYVTLEPCSTHGRTPPCTEAITSAGISRTVIGTLDPNPRHAGRAVGLLQARGVAVETGVLEESCRQLNLAFNRWIVTGRPWVIAKAALTLDGRFTLPPGAGRWLSGPEARAHAHGQRALVDAILIGAGTLRRDDPRLTVRGAAEAGRQPWRVVMAGRGALPAEAHLFRDEFRDRTLVLSNLTPSEALAELGKRQITSVMVEGGPTILSAFLAEGLADEAHLYLTPWLGGGPAIAAGSDAFTPRQVRAERLGPDIFLRALVESRLRSAYDKPI